MSKNISDRQKRRIRKRIAKQTVDIEIKQKELKYSLYPSLPETLSPPISDFKVLRCIITTVATCILVTS